jgi:hypothetical protein
MESAMSARIYKPAKSAMQSGQAPREWVLDFAPARPREIEPLMGWTSGSDTRAQVRMSFNTLEEAVAYATRNGVAFRIEEPRTSELKSKSYAENFKFGRPDRWTH